MINMRNENPAPVLRPVAGGGQRRYTRATLSRSDSPHSSVWQRPGVALQADAEQVRAFLDRCARAIERHREYLTRLDAVLGDGDHGDNMAIGFEALRELLASYPAETSPGELLRAVGHRLATAVGGASPSSSDPATYVLVSPNRMTLAIRGVRKDFVVARK